MKTNKINNQAGFTLIELILVVAIIGMLTAAIAPSFGSLLATTSSTSHKGAAGQIQSAINVYAAKQIASGSSFSLTALDTLTAATTTCSGTTGCFNNVTPTFSSANWKKTATSGGTCNSGYNSGGTYAFTGADSVSVTYTYCYNSTEYSGYFKCTSGSTC